MANTTLKKVSVNIKLDNGTDGMGNQRIVSVSLGTLNKDNFDADKVIAVISKLGPCLDKEILAIEKAELSTITASA